MTKVINFFGEPGSGKTTTALGLTYYAKREGFSVEYMSEVARELAYAHRIETTQQYDILIAQYRRLIALDGKVDFIITDSPLLLTCVYTQDSFEIADAIMLADKFDNVNFLLQRKHDYFRDKGRVHTETQAEYIADKIDDMFSTSNLKHESGRIPHVRVMSDAIHVAWFYLVLSKMSQRVNNDQSNYLHTNK